MLQNGVNHVSLSPRDTGRVVAFYRESRHPAARRGLRRPAAGYVRRMTATIRPAGLALAALPSIQLRPGKPGPQRIWAQL